MTNALKNDLKKCDCLGDMLLELRKHYFVNQPVGLISKGLIITGINSSLEKKLDAKTIIDLKNSNTLGDMIAIFSTYNTTNIAEEHKPKVIDGIGKIIIMTRLKAK